MLASGQEDSVDIVAALIKAKADPNIKHRVSIIIIVKFILTLLLYM